jgi:hypothetical protein
MPMKTLPARLCIEWIMGRAQRVFFVYGMRRSGNHACVGWLVNALEREAVALIESNHVKNFNYSGSGATFYANDVSTLASRRYLKCLYHDLKKIRAAKFIIISAEDQTADYRQSWRIPRRSETIFVHRDTLNLMASRYQNLNRRAREGLGANMQSMKTRFFAALIANIERPQGLVWDFERWHHDEAWRKAFLAQLGLEHDILPPTVGLGSSFSGDRQVVPNDKFGQRFTMVEPHDAWVSFIHAAASEHPDAFTPAERESIRRLVTP